MPPIDYAPLTAPFVTDPGLSDLGRRISSFAIANGGQLYLMANEQPLPGVIFRDQRGRARDSQLSGDIVRFPGPPLIEVGNAVYMRSLHLTVFSRIAQRWGYAALQLPAALPSLVLESDRAHAQKALPLGRGATGTAVPGPHGTFRLFTDAAGAAFAPELLTPAVLAALDDGTFGFDLEIAPGWLFLYAPGTLSTADPGLWRRIFEALDAVRRALDPHG